MRYGLEGRVEASGEGGGGERRGQSGKGEGKAYNDVGLHK